jgi:CRP-like cAMP-binding protein
MALADDLKQVPLFGGLSDRELKRIAGDFKERDYDVGTTPLREEQMSGIGFFVITEGEASVSRGGKELARLGPGDHFGELALISDQARTATVTAETPLRTVMLSSWEFRDIVKQNPEIAWTLLQHVVGLLVDTERGSAAGAAPPA